MMAWRQVKIVIYCVWKLGLAPQVSRWFLNSHLRCRPVASPAKTNRKFPSPAIRAWLLCQVFWWGHLVEEDILKHGRPLTQLICKINLLTTKKSHPLGHMSCDIPSISFVNACWFTLPSRQKKIMPRVRVHFSTVTKCAISNDTVISV